MSYRIHIFAGESGGIGKTTVCTAAIAALETTETPFTIFETDRTKPDVYERHKHLDCRLAALSEADRLQDAFNPIFNTALERTVLVNLAAASFIALSQWFANNELDELAAEFETRFIHWFVMDGSQAGVSLLKRSIKHFNKETMQHVAVRNLGKSDQWDAFDQDAELQTLLTALTVPVVDFPRFHGEAQLQTIEREHLSLKKAAHYQGFDAIPRQRVKRFVRESGKALTATSLLP